MRLSRSLAGAALAMGVAAPVAAQQAAVSLSCVPTAVVANRPSPYDSLKIDLAGKKATLCFSRPSAKGRP